MKYIFGEWCRKLSGFKLTNIDFKKAVSTDSNHFTCPIITQSRTIAANPEVAPKWRGMGQAYVCFVDACGGQEQNPWAKWSLPV